MLEPGDYGYEKSMMFRRLVGKMVEPSILFNWLVYEYEIRVMLYGRSVHSDNLPKILTTDIIDADGYFHNNFNFTAYYYFYHGTFQEIVRTLGDVLFYNDYRDSDKILKDWSLFMADTIDENKLVKISRNDFNAWFERKFGFRCTSYEEFRDFFEYQCAKSYESIPWWLCVLFDIVVHWHIMRRDLNSSSIKGGRELETGFGKNYDPIPSSWPSSMYQSWLSGTCSSFVNELKDDFVKKSQISSNWDELSNRLNHCQLGVWYEYYWEYPTSGDTNMFRGTIQLRYPGIWPLTVDEAGFPFEYIDNIISMSPMISSVISGGYLNPYYNYYRNRRSPQFPTLYNDKLNEVTFNLKAAYTVDYNTSYFYYYNSFLSQVQSEHPELSPAEQEARAREMTNAVVVPVTDEQIASEAAFRLKPFLSQSHYENDRCFDKDDIKQIFNDMDVCLEIKTYHDPDYTRDSDYVLRWLEENYGITSGKHLYSQPYGEWVNPLKEVNPIEFVKDYVMPLSSEVVLSGSNKNYYHKSTVGFIQVGICYDFKKAIDFLTPWLDFNAEYTDLKTSNPIRSKHLPY